MELTGKQFAVLAEVERDEAIRDHFFRKAKGMVWFHELRRRGLLRPDQNPRPFEAKDEVCAYVDSQHLGGNSGANLSYDRRGRGL